MSTQDLGIDPSEVGALAPAEEKRKRSKEACSNCGSDLQGAFCHECGQPTRHFIRFFPVVVREIAEDTLGVDGRFWRTFVALLFRPGRLTLDYLNGKRVFYSPPIRLYLLSSVLAFLVITNIVDSALDSNKVAIQAAQELDDSDNIGLVFGADEEQKQSRKAFEIRKKTFEELRHLATIDEQDLAQEMGLKLDEQGEVVDEFVEVDAPANSTDELPVDEEQQKNERFSLNNENSNETTTHDDASPPDGLGVPGVPPVPANPPSIVNVSEDDDDLNLVFFGSEPWDAETNPLELSFLTEGMNDRLNREIGEFKARYPEIKKNPRILVDEILEVLPQTMFLLLPAFAIILKFFYLFARRYYMEHLIFALHNHAFVYAVISLAAIVNWLAEWLDSGMDIYTDWSGYFNGALQLWLFIYLFLAQKRVYGQGFILTSIKYIVVGISYSVLLSIVAMIASLVGIILV